MIDIRLLITGHRGRLGSELLDYFGNRYHVTGIDRDELDISDKEAVFSYINNARPQIIIHTAALTDVDWGEHNRREMMTVNARGTENIARASRKIGARLVYYSTNFVFEGSKNIPYTENDPPLPQSVYGLSKLKGEETICDISRDYAILRIGWVYGKRGNDFVETMLNMGKKQLRDLENGKTVDPIFVVTDQIGNPTSADQIARQTEIVLEKNLRGLFHCATKEFCTKFEFARKIFEKTDMPVIVKPCLSDRFESSAKRPAMAALSNNNLERSGSDMMDKWQTALAEFLNERQG